MKRRTFLQGLGAAAALLPARGVTLSSAASTDNSESEKDELIKLFVRNTDDVIRNFLPDQQTEADSPFRGGFTDNHGLYGVQQSTGCIARMLAGLLSPESSYYRSVEIEKRLDMAIDYVWREQHEDGTIDYFVTNYHSPPDTAFVVLGLATSLKYVRQIAPKKLAHFQQVCSKFLTRAGAVLARGGVHTPNHRWVVCNALARIHNLLPDKRYVERIDEWLSEGIDIDSDGQYTEKSAIYTPIVNQSLITVARLMDRKELYAPVRKNLEMGRYLFHVNGEPLTEISSRRDRSQRIKPMQYYYPYRYMAFQDGNGFFSAMARFIEESIGREKMAAAIAPFFYDDREKLASMPSASPLPKKYERLFPSSKFVRILADGADASILADNSTVFSLYKGDAVLQAVRMASAFFGKGQFNASDLRKNKDGYVLSQRLTAAYYQPLPPEFVRDDGNWHKMPKSRRNKSELQELIAKIIIRRWGGGYKLHFDVQGTDDVPVAIELAFRNGGQLTGVTPIDDARDCFFLGKGGGSYRVGDDVIRFSHGPSEHTLIQPRGAAPSLDAQRVYITGCTPLDYELTIS